MEELNLGPPNTDTSSSRKEDLNSGPPDYKSSAQTNRPRRVHCHCLLSLITLWNKCSFATLIKFCPYKIGMGISLGSRQDSQRSQKRLVASRYSLRSTCFAKYRVLNLHILHFRCFIPCLGYQTEESDCCDTGYIHFSTSLFILICFISFRFAKYSKPLKVLDCLLNKIEKY